MADILGQPAAHFLEKHWQKSPAWGRAWLQDKSLSLTPTLLRDLAAREDVDSRLIIGPDSRGHWKVDHGPFSAYDFEQLPNAGWTLLIQDLEKWVPSLRRLWSRFEFVPTWRRDDLMISWAMPGGSVGPHVDRYDVFLAQICGEREWTTGSPGDAFNQADTDGLKLCQLKRPLRHPSAGPGDVLYLPPGVAHHGIALSECMTLSFGMRAPSVCEVMLEFAQDAASRDEAEALYTDADLQVGEDAGWLSETTTTRLHNMLNQGLQTEKLPLQLWAARFLTSFSARREIPAPTFKVDETQIRADLRAGRKFQFSPWSRRLGVRGDHEAWLAIDGESYGLSRELAATLLAEDAKHVGRDMSAADLLLLVELLATGTLVWSDHD